MRYEVPSYVTHPSDQRAHVGAVQMEDTLRALVLPPMSGFRDYHVPAYVAGGFTHTGADAATVPATTDTSDPSKLPSTDTSSAASTGMVVAVVGGILVIAIAIEVGIGYITYKLSKSVPVTAIVGFLTGGPVGLVASYVGGTMAAKKG